jgi:hypothetical protein
MDEIIIFENLTPHAVIIYGKTMLVIQPSGLVARCDTITEEVGTLNGIPLVKNTFGQIQDLPEPKRNTVYIVSSLVAAACPDRKDLVSPDTTPQSVIRDENGRITGVKRLQIFYQS